MNFLRIALLRAPLMLPPIGLMLFDKNARRNSHGRLLDRRM